ncbi:MAG: hypothetical protein ABI633_01955, partial [Burkholderiales bacterium]
MLLPFVSLSVLLIVSSFVSPLSPPVAALFASQRSLGAPRSCNQTMALRLGQWCHETASGHLDGRAATQFPQP